RKEPQHTDAREVSGLHRVPPGHSRKNAAVGRGEDVQLEIDVVKTLREFTLRARVVAGGKPLAVLGPSGSGKSMLLKCIAGIAEPDSGRIVLGGNVLFDSV